MLTTLLLSLVFAQVPPTAAHTGKTGTTVFLTAPIPTPFPTAPPTPTVLTPPVLIRGDNTNITLIPGPADGYYYSFRLPPGVVLNPLEPLSITASPNWIKNFPAVNLAVRNSTNQIEFQIAKPTMGLGLNTLHDSLTMGSSGAYPANWARRLEAFSQVTGIDTQGNPTRIVGTRATARFTGSFTNRIDAAGVPGLLGKYVLIWDSPNSSTVLTIESIDKMHTITYDPNCSTVSGNTYVKAFDVSKSPTCKTNAPYLSLVVTHPQGTPIYSNLAIIPPGNRIDRSDPFAVEQSIIDQISVSTYKGPSIIRMMDATGTNSAYIKDIKDLPDASQTSWITTTPYLNANIIAARPIDLTKNPVIQFETKNIPISNFAPWAIGKRAIVEFVTSQPHGYSSGQIGNVTFAQPIPITIGGQPATLTSGYKMLWITSPNSFIVPFNIGLAPQTGGCTIDAPVNVTNSGVVVRTRGPMLPYEFLASMASRFDGCILWINISPIATDATIDEIGKRILAYLKPGHKVVVEYGNEVWNFAYGFYAIQYITAMSQLLNGPKAISTDFYIQRAMDVSNRIKAVFATAGRQDDVLSVLAWQHGTVGHCLTRATMMKVAADVVSVAPYYEALDSWYPSTESWNDGQMQDLWRTHLVHGHKPAQLWQSWLGSVLNYERSIGKRTLRYTYEAGIDEPLPSSSTNMAARANNFLAHPDMYDTERVRRTLEQARGVDILVDYGHLLPVAADGRTFGIWLWQNQLSGYGNGSDGIPPNVFIDSTMVYPIKNTSVRGAAWRDWQRDFLLSK